ncbi:18790_t:CDS:2 [Gigaspora margarita]|uniref:18790_t:CDS:1 n=1 Tax=Gigaspora margarita TaxID=4874 RepID=A0ABN7V7E1_GIGMA|nr:18790_t:CDS:2 [Gigaspora margarita]
MNQSDDLVQKYINEEHVKFYEYSHFKDVKLLGEGEYGKVYRAIFKNNELIVALKSFRSNTMIKEIANELNLHRRVDKHSNIIRLHGVTKIEDKLNQSSTDYMLVLEYADSGTLSHQLAPLIVDNSNGARESPVEGTPPAYVQIYTDCWQHDPELCPEIQKVFLELEDLNTNNEQATNDNKNENPNTSVGQQIYQNSSELNMLNSD